MSTTSVVTCDVCGAQKRTENNWFVAWIIPTSGLFNTVTYDAYIAYNVHYPNAKDCCGLECATKLFQRFLAHGTLEQQP